MCTVPDVRDTGALLTTCCMGLRHYYNFLGRLFFPPIICLICLYLELFKGTSHVAFEESPWWGRKRISSLAEAAGCKHNIKPYK